MTEVIERRRTHVEFLKEQRVLAKFAPTASTLRVRDKIFQLVLPVVIEVDDGGSLRVGTFELDIDAVSLRVEDVWSSEIGDAERVVHGRAFVEREDVLVRRGKEVEEGVKSVPQRGVGFQRGGRGRRGSRRFVDQLVRVGCARAKQSLVVVRAENGSVGDVQRLQAGRIGISEKALF